MSIVAVAGASVISPLLGLGLPIAAAAAHDGACTSADTSKNATTYGLSYATGNITAAKAGFYTNSSSSRGQTTQSCVAYTSSDNEVYAHASSSSLDYVGATCSGSAGSASETITLSKAATNTAETISATLKSVSGSGGKGDPCVLSKGSQIQVVVTPSAGGACKAGDTFTVSPKGQSLSEYDCSNGAQTYRVYTNTGDDKTYSILTGGSAAALGGAAGCGDGYNASITLNEVPTNSTPTVGGSLQPLRNTGKGACGNDGAAKSITVTVTVVDLTGIDSAFQPIATQYANIKCDAANAQAQGADAYGKCLQTNVSNFKQLLDQCKADPKNATTADLATCMEGKTPEVKDALAALLAPDDKSACPVDGIGWIVCPVLNAVGGLDDAMWGLTSSLLTVSPLQQYQTDASGAVVKDGSGKPTPTTAFAMWKAFWSITNVGFVIIFLVIIFAQLSGAGIGNYGVKKMLPRFVIDVLLAALSFSLIQVAVDLSNIFGKSIYDLMDSITNNNTAPATWSGGTESLIGLIIAGGLTGAGIATIGAGTALMFILPGALAVFIGFLAALLTLIFRQALIPILAVVAPLAILAYVLPNTQKWFDKWRGLFLTMLMLFPLAALLFGGVKMAAYMINSGGTAWSKLIALIVMGVPLFALPFIARQAGPMLSKIQDGAKSLGGRFQKPVKDWAGKQRARGLAQADASAPGRFNFGRRIRQAAVRRGRRTDLRTAAWGAESDAAFNKDLAANAPKLAGEFPEDGAGAAHIRAVAARAQAEEVKLAMDSMKLEANFNPNDRVELAKALAHAIQQGDQTRATGLTNYLVAARGVDELHSTLVAAQAAGHMDTGMSTALQRAMTSSENGGVVKERRPDLTTWGAKGGGVSAVSGTPGTWAISADDAAGLSEGAMSAAQATGGLSAEIAQRVLDTPQLRGRLDPRKEVIMQEIAGRSTGKSGVGPIGSEVIGQEQTRPDELNIPRT